MEKEKKKMGRPTDSPKNIRLYARLDEETQEDYLFCQKELGVSGSEIIRMGIKLIKENILKNK